MKTDPTVPDALPPLAGIAPVARPVKAGTALFHQGDRSFGIFRLVTGRISLVRVTPCGTEVPMHTVRPSELFAEASLFSPRYHCDARALRDSEVLVYPKEALTRQIKESKEALWAFTAGLAQHVHGLRTRLELRQIRSAPERVLQALRLRCDEHGAWKPDAPLKQFAEEIGLTHEALYRSLAALEREARIERNRGEIVVVRDVCACAAGVRTSKNQGYAD